LIRIVVVNSGSSDVVLQGAEGLIVEANTSAPLRRFFCIMNRGEETQPQAAIAAHDSVELTLRSPSFVEPFDVSRYRDVRVMLTFNHATGQKMSFTSPSVGAVKTQ
jgi:hypothetical protein